MDSSEKRTRWAVIEQLRDGDSPDSSGVEFVTWCNSQQEAEDLARRN